MFAFEIVIISSDSRFGVNCTVHIDFQILSVAKKLSVVLLLKFLLFLLLGIPQKMPIFRLDVNIVWKIFPKNCFRPCLARRMIRNAFMRYVKIFGISIAQWSCLYLKNVIVRLPIVFLENRKQMAILFLLISRLP